MKKMSIKFLLLIMGIMLITACGKKDSGEKQQMQQKLEDQ